MKTVLIVDDNATSLAMAKEVLNGHYQTLTLSSAEKMFALFKKIKPDLILLDIEMPEMDGFTAIEKLKANENTVDIPVIFLTVHTDAEKESKGLELGAVDFVGKPFSSAVLLNRIANHLRIDEMIKKRTERIERLHQLRIDEAVKKRTERIERLQSGIVFTLANIAESGDKMTKGHIERTSLYVKILIDAMLAKGLYLDEMVEWDLNLVAASALLHDIGKFSIPSSILNKPAKLTPEEFAEMQQHVEEGELIIDQMIEKSGNALFLRHAKLFAGFHHERWDGKGYPREFKGEEIPLQGRIMAIVDVYDALISERPYKPVFSCEKAEEIILEGSGTLFDPKITDVFQDVKNAFAMVVKDYRSGS
ncbi:MAG: response regulator [Fibromonadaceae bacterium]|jgi:putative two-component system response regulator|nr:response regulator [Fibromonadaceae bacterium]